jgi:hypothetical protein
MEVRMESAEAIGKQVLDALPARCAAADKVLASHFGASPVAFRAAARTAAAPRKSNAELLKHQEAVHGLLIEAMADLRALEFWLHTRVPTVSDGNNFGAEVQSYVIEQLAKMRAALAASADGGVAYLNARAQGCEKLGGSKTSETTAVESTETKAEADGAPKKTVVSKLDKTDKTTAKDECEDYAHHLVELDVKQYVALEGHVRDVLMTYVRAHELVSKNRDKCEFPRGERTDGGRPHSMY